MDTDNPAAIALAALQKAKPEQYQVVAWYIEHPGSTQEEIAAALGCSQPNVSKLLERGLKNFETLKSRAARSSASERNNS